MIAAVLSCLRKRVSAQRLLEDLRLSTYALHIADGVSGPLPLWSPIELCLIHPRRPLSRR